LVAIEIGFRRLAARRFGIAANPSAFLVRIEQVRGAGFL
jgi:hypothetical protein